MSVCVFVCVCVCVSGWVGAFAESDRFFLSKSK